MGLLELLGRWLPTVGFLGAEAFWLGAYVWGRWRPWPARLVLERTKAWPRPRWRRDRDGWLLASMIAALIYLVFLGVSGGII